MVSGQYAASLGSGARFCGKREMVKGLRDWFTSWTLWTQKTLFLRKAHLGIFLQKLLPFCPVLSYWVHRNMLRELYRDRTSELGVSLEIMESNPCRSRAQSSIQVGAASVSLISWLPRWGKGRVPDESSRLDEAEQICALALSHSHCATSRQQSDSGPPSPHLDKVVLRPNNGSFQFCVDPTQKQ